MIQWKTWQRFFAGFILSAILFSAGSTAVEARNLILSESYESTDTRNVYDPSEEIHGSDYVEMSRFYALRVVGFSDMNRYLEVPSTGPKTSEPGKKRESMPVLAPRRTRCCIR